MLKLAQDRSKQLVEMLCVAYSKELKAYHGYLHAYVTVTGPLESVYSKIFKTFMERELHHLEELGKKIRVMGGMPPIEYPSVKPVADAVYKGYDATLAILQQAEIETLEMYTTIREAATKADDVPLALLIEEIMKEEEEHHDELELLLLDVPKKNNVELHDKLEVRKQKAAKLFDEISIKPESDTIVPPFFTEQNEIKQHTQDALSTIQHYMDNAEEIARWSNLNPNDDPEYKALRRTHDALIRELRKMEQK